MSISIKNNKNICFILFGVGNSFYLSYMYLIAFMLEKNIDEMTRNFAISIFTIIGILCVFSLINSFINKSEKTLFTSPFFKFLYIFALINIITIIYNSFLEEFSLFFVSILYESVCFLFSTIIEQRKRINKLVAYSVLCGFILLFSFNIEGFFEKYLSVNKIKSDLLILYVAIFYHLSIGCFIFYFNKQLVGIKN